MSRQNDKKGQTARKKGKLIRSSTSQSILIRWPTFVTCIILSRFRLNTQAKLSRNVWLDYLLLWVFVCMNMLTHIFFFIPSGPLSCFEGFTVLGYYNGSMSQTDSGFPCLKWTEFPDYMLQYPGRGLGDHSYCRNPDRESQPWCFFRQHSGAIGWAYCNCHQGEGPDLNVVYAFIKCVWIFFRKALVLKTMLKPSCSWLQAGF